MMRFNRVLFFLLATAIYCQTQVDDCFITYAGCTCLEDWSYNGVTGLSGCANPDNDTVGSWCLVQETDSCEVGKPLGTLPLADNAPFDYCQKQCQIVTEGDFAGRSIFDSFFQNFQESDEEDDTIIVQSNTGRLPWNSAGIFKTPSTPSTQTFLFFGYNNMLAYGGYDVTPAPTPAPTPTPTPAPSIPQNQDGKNETDINGDSFLSQIQIYFGNRFTPSEAPPSVQDPTPAPVPAPVQVSGSFDRDYLNSHNSRRGRHCQVAMTWDAELAAQAQEYANECIFEHSQNRGGAGENLFLGKGTKYSSEDVVGMWYDEIQLYDYTDPGFSMDTGHFTQVVWEDSILLGCGEKTDCSIGQIVVCQYKSAGNVQGQYVQKVKELCV